MVRGCASVQDHGILFKRVEFFPRIPWRSTCRSLFASRQGSRFGRVAQLVEHSTLNRLVAGSIPAASTIYYLESMTYNDTSDCAARRHELVAVLMAVEKRAMTSRGYSGKFVMLGPNHREFGSLITWT
jgi:hypothetical protein